MTQFLTITSGKGGTGKTTTAINVGTALSQFGRDVIVVDGNLHNPNISLHLGNPMLPITLRDVSKGTNSIRQAAYQHPSGLKVIPGNIIDEIEKQDFKRVEHSFLDLMGATELVLIDTSSQPHEEIMNVAGKTLVVTTPDLTSVTDTLRTIKKTEEKGIKVLGVVVNKIKGKNELSVSEIKAMLDRPIIGEVPYDEKVEESHASKHPVTYLHPEAESTQSFKRIATNLIGNANQ